MRLRYVALVGSLLLFTMMAEFGYAGRRGGGSSRREGKLKVGDTAPDFDLKKLVGKGKVKLSGLRGQKPVMLIFGSYT